MGILAKIKFLAPQSLYLLSMAFVLRGFLGDGRWALLLVTFLLPLRNIVDRIAHFPAGNQVVDLLIVSSIVGWFIQCMIQKRKIFDHAPLNIFSAILVIYLLLSVVLGTYYLTGSFSINLSDERVKDWKNFCMLPMLFFATFNHVTDRKWIHRILFAMLFAIFIMEYYIVNQVTWYSSLLSRAKITGTFQFLGPNEVAAFLNQFTLIMMGVFYYVKDKRIKWPLLLMILINIYCIVFLYSRGAYLGMFVGMAFLFAIKDKKFMIPLILALVFWQFVLPEKAIERIKGTKNEYGELDQSAERRIEIWKQAFELYQNNPVTGIGYGVFRFLGLDLGDTHNIYIKILVEQGTIGLLIFLLVVFSFFRMGFVLYQKGQDDLDKGMGLGLMACIITLLINNFFGDRWSYLEMSSYLWIFGGLVARLIIINTQPQSVATLSKKPNIAVKPTTPTPAVASVAEPKAKKKLRYYDLNRPENPS